MDSEKNFHSRPTKGWPHQESELMNGGVTFAVKYIGCIEISTSMKLLDFQTRSAVAK